MAKTDDELLKLAKARWEQGTDANKTQLGRELEDIQFYNGEQWPDDVKAARQGQDANNGLPPVPARPCITINKVRQPVLQVVNQMRSADMGIEIVPADDFVDVEGATGIDHTEIELREGLVRRIQRESAAQDARLWGADRAAQAGRGYYSVMTRYVKQGITEKPDASWFDQEVYVHRFYNQSAVTIDPAHEQPDGSDAEWEFVGTDMPWDAYVAKYGEERAQKISDSWESMSDEEFRNIGNQAPGWFYVTGPENKRTKMCRVVDYWYKERETKTLVALEDGSYWWKDQAPKDTKIEHEREVTKETIYWCQLDGKQVLEKSEWSGRYMPIVKVLGNELQPHDEDRRCEGVVRPAREGNQALNFMVSKQVEVIGLAPLTPLMVAEGQVEGYEEWYAQANTRTLPYLPYRTKDLEGNQVPPPFPAPRETPIQAVTASVQMFDEFIKDTTGVPSVTLGDTDPSLKTARGAKLLLDQARQGTSNYLDNLARSLRYEALIINDLLFPIYGNRPGRLAKIVNGQNEAQTILIGQPFTYQGEGVLKRPVPAQPNSPDTKEYKLTPDAQFNAAVKVTRDFETRREQSTQQLGELMSANPDFMSVFGDIYFENADIPGNKQLAERAKVMLAPPVQQMLEGKESGQKQLPPQVQMQMQQMGQLNEQLTERVKQLEQEQAAKTQESMADIEKAKIDGQFKIAIEQIKADTQLKIAQLRASTEAVLQDDQQRHEHAEQAVDRHHEHATLDKQTQLAEAQAENSARRGFAQGEVDHAHAVDQGDRGHQQALESQEQQAELQPKPKAGE